MSVQITQTAAGLQIGEVAGSLIAFHGATPVAQPAGATQAAVTATSTDGTAAAASADLAALAAECEKIGDDARAAIVLLNVIRTVLVNNGLMKGAA